MQHHWLLPIAVCCLCAAVTPLAAQDRAAEPPVSAVRDLEKLPEKSLIYLPYQNLKQVFQKHGAAALMPLEEYLRLWKVAAERITPERPPVGGVISKASYVGAVEQDLVRVQATLTILILEDGWVEIPVSFGEAAISSVTGEPESVLLRGTGNGTYALMFKQAGQHTVQLELTARVRVAPEGRSFELQIPNVAMTTFELRVPEKDQSIELTPKLLQESVGNGAESTQIRASLGSTNRVSAKWHPRVGTKPDMELLASATAATLVSIENGLIHFDAHFQLEVLRGQLETVRIAIPKGQRILDVTSTVGIKEWTISEEESRQVVSVVLLNRQAGKIPLEIHTELPLSNEPFDVAGRDGRQSFGIHLLDVLRESGQVALRAASDLQLNIGTQQGLARIDEAEADSRLRKPGVSYFRYFTPDIRLTATAKPLQPRLTVDHQADVVITNDQMRLNSALTYQIERAGLFELVVGLPEGLSVEHVESQYFKDYHLSADGRTLTIALREGRQGEVKAGITLIKSRDTSTQVEEFDVPLLEPKNVDVEIGRLRLLAPETLELMTDAASIVGFQPDQNPVTSPVANSRLVSAWQFQRRPVAMKVKSILKPTRLTAEIGSTVDVQQSQTRVESLVAYLVEYAGLDTFRIAVPEIVADSVQIHLTDNNVPPIRQRTRDEPADGWVTWTILLQRDFVGVVKFRVTYDLPPSEKTGPAEATTVPLIRALEPFEADEDDPPPRMIPLSRISGEAAVKKDRVLSVAASAEGGDVETVDIRELTLLPAEGIAAFRYYQQPVQLKLTASKYEIQSVIETVVSKGLAEVVLDLSGVAMVRARFQLKSSERQRLRVDLPAGIEPLGAELDGKSIPLEKNPDAKPADGWDAYYVNVARTKSSDQTFQLTVQYRQTIQSPPFQTRGGDLRLRLPALGGTDGGVPVQQFRVAIWVPNEFALVGIPDHFEQRHRPTWRELFWSGRNRTAVNETEQWFDGSTGGVFDFPVEGQDYVYSNLGGRPTIDVHWWYLPFYTWIVSGTLVLIAIILRNTSWENKLTMLIGAAFLATAYAIKDADLVLHGLAVAAYGLVALIVLWLLHGLLNFSSSRRSPRKPPTSSPPGRPPAVVIPPPGVFDSVTLGMQ